jgi:hypothetical protein
VTWVQTNGIPRPIAATATAMPYWARRKLPETTPRRVIVSSVVWPVSASVSAPSWFYGTPNTTAGPVWRPACSWHRALRCGPYRSFVPKVNDGPGGRPSACDHRRSESSLLRRLCSDRHNIHDLVRRGTILYATRERALIANFVSQGTLLPSAYMAAAWLRFAFYGALQALIWTFVTLPIANIISDPLTLDVLFVNTTIYAWTWTVTTFAAAHLPPTGFASHSVMILDSVATYLCGTFFLWSRLYGFVRWMHYLNPLFYMASANAILLTNSLDSQCGEKDFPGQCANSDMLLEMTEVQEITSLEAQGMNLAFALVFSGLWWWRARGRSLRRVARKVRLTGEDLQGSEQMSLNDEEESQEINNNNNKRSSSLNQDID